MKYSIFFLPFPILYVISIIVKNLHISPFFQDAAIISVGITTATTIIIQVFNEKSKIKRETIDRISKTLQKDFSEEKRKFVKLKNKNISSEKYLNKKNDSYYLILYILNNYELDCMSIRNKYLDEKTYKSFYKSLLVTDWEFLEPFVFSLRKNLSQPSVNKDKIFSNFEYLANSWKEKKGFIEKYHINLLYIYIIILLLFLVMIMF